MKILVNAIPLMGLVTGISRYLRALYHELGRIPGVRVCYFTGTTVCSQMPPAAAPARWITNTSLIWKLPDPIVFALRSVHWLRYEHYLRQAVRKGHFDLYHETAFIPARMTGIPTVYSIYDLSLITFPKHHPRERVWFHDFFLPRRLQYASHILTISHFSRREIRRILKFAANRISTVHLAPAEHFAPRSTAAADRVRQQYGISQNYFLFVGSLEPRKNLDLIIRAMALQARPIPLVLAGWTGWGDKRWLETLPRPDLKPKIILPGYVDDETLACLYSGARALLYPSLYEGFGLPVVEAMACDCPVICSDTSSLPEVAEDAAIQISPHSALALADAMTRLASDDQLRNRLIQKGRMRAAQFTWNRAAQETLKVFEHVVRER